MKQIKDIAKNDIIVTMWYNDGLMAVNFYKIGTPTMRRICNDNYEICSIVVNYKNDITDPDNFMVQNNLFPRRVKLDEMMIVDEYFHEHCVFIHENIDDTLTQIETFKNFHAEKLNDSINEKNKLIDLYNDAINYFTEFFKQNQEVKNSGKYKVGEELICIKYPINIKYPEIKGVYCINDFASIYKIIKDHSTHYEKSSHFVGFAHKKGAAVDDIDSYIKYDFKRDGRHTARNGVNVEWPNSLETYIFDNIEAVKKFIKDSYWADSDSLIKDYKNTISELNNKLSMLNECYQKAISDFNKIING